MNVMDAFGEEHEIDDDDIREEMENLGIENTEENFNRCCDAIKYDLDNPYYMSELYRSIIEAMISDVKNENRNYREVV